MSNNPEQIQDSPPLKRALFALKDLRARLNSIETSQVEPIAVIGLGCRFPGKATSPEKYWRLLHEGIDAIGDVPLERWDADAFYDPDPDKPGKMITRQGGFIEYIDQFDANFFGISPREADSMDPQQRLLLETSWEALESAGIAPERLAGSLTAVYVGISTSDYVHLSVKYGAPDQIDPYIGTGGAFSVAAGRLSYLLGLQGPNLAIDTACSSSLVAVHLACQALRTGQANLAIVAGVNLILTPEASIYMSKARALSPDGRCRTFAAAADGYGRGEGCGAVILKRLSDAQADNDPILAVIRGTAVNHDGRSSGLTVPNGQAQQEVIRAALQNAGGLDPHAINYLEAHGTGTPLGDPIEIRAATAVLGKNRTADNPLYIGSVKTNIGHLEAAAGIAGLIKLVLALQHEELPPQLHFDEPSPHIAWDAIPVQVLTKRQPWAGDNRLAGLSSFGFSGTNAHIIVGAAPLSQVVSDEATPIMAERPFHLLTLSARTDNALHELISQYHAFLETNPDDSLANVAYTSGSGRSHFEHRLAVVAQNLADAREKLAAALAQPLTAAPITTPKIAFLFTGQGAQYPGMGRQLYQVEPVFKEAIDQCAAILDGYLERPLLSVLFAEAEDEGDAALIHQTAYTQPSLFAIEYALAQVWLSWGVKPTAVMGHSIGEIVAACLAGILSLDDALKLVYERGRLMQSLPADGAMAAVFADEACVAAALTGYADQVSIAALNGPQHVVISGTATAVAAVLSRLEADGVQSRLLTVSHAFHSPLMEPILADFEQAVGALTYHKPRLRLISNLTGRQLQENEAQTAVYWRAHIRQPVQFASSVQTLLNDGITHFLEIGPQPILLGMARQLPGVDAVTQVASLRRNLPDWQQMLIALGSLYEAGAGIDWQAVYHHQPRRPVRLPTYPFQRKRYWHAATPHPVQLTTIPETAVFNADEWLYQIMWEPSERLESVPPSPGSWLILADAQGVGEKLVAQVQAQGGHCHVITQNQLQANNQTVAQWLAATTSLQSGQTPLYVVYLWGLDAADAPMAEAACLSVLHLLQSVAAHSVALPKLWLVTAGAQVVSPGEQPMVWQSPLWGLGKTMALEHPKLWGGLIDLDLACWDDAAALLMGEIQQSDGEQQIGWRDGRRYVARLVQADSHIQTRDLPLRPDGSYLITGGLGALGLYVAHWLVQRGARRLILLGRTPLPPRREWSQVDSQTAVGQKIAAIRQLEMAGAAVHTAVVDIGNAAQLGNFLAEYAAEGWPPVSGVIHAAGVLADHSLLNMDAAAWSAVFQPKVSGAWHLHTLLHDVRLDFFVLFSSFAAMTGAAGQANYAAANEFLAALAHHRRANNLPALAIHWGPWAEAGMAARADVQERRRRAGIADIEPAQGVALLGRFLAADVTAVGVMPVAAGQLRRLLPVALPLMAHLPDDGGDETAVSDPAHIRSDILDSAEAERPWRMVHYLRQCVADVLRLSPADIAVTRNVMELGLDSIMVMELIQRLDRELSLTIYPREVFERPSVQALADYLLAELLGSVGRSATETTESQGQNDMLTIVRRDALPAPTKRNLRAVFLLSTPRAGSTLLRVMLAGHPDLFCPPELHLLPFNDLASREAELAGSYLDEGLQRAIMELMGQDAADSAAMLAEWHDENLTTPQVYGRLQSLAGSRLLVDKSPSYALDAEVLRRAEQQFEDALYIHLVRHPYAVVASFTKNRMDRLMGQSDADPYQMGEQIWTMMNNNILDFLDSIGGERGFQVRYEDLVTDPEPVMRELCAFLGIEFLPALLLPYEGERMTDGVHAASLAIGDPNFHKRQRIEPALANAWQTADLPRRLGRAARQLAAEFAYDLPWPLQLAPEETAVSLPPKREKPVIQPVERGQNMPLSFTQQRLWFLDQFEPGTTTFNLPLATRLTGRLNVPALEASLQRIVERHEVMRTTFAQEDGRPVQQIHSSMEIVLPLVDLSHLPMDERLGAATQQIELEAKKPFDLTQGPLLRGKLFRLNDSDHILLFVQHHIVTDGWSMGLLWQELTSYYNAMVTGKPISFAPLPIQYADYAAWQQKWMESEAFQGQLDYWLKHLNGTLPVLELPLGHPRSTVQAHRGGTIYRTLSTDLVQAVRRLGQAQGATMFMTVLAAFKALLYRYTGQEDLLIGTSIANRNQAETNRLIGFFVNTLLLRTDLSGEPSFQELLERVKRVALEAFAHQEMPVEKLIELLQPERENGRSVLFDVLIVFQNTPDFGGSLIDMGSSQLTLEFERAMFDLTLYVIEKGDDLILKFEYNADLFEAATIERLFAHFETLLHSIVAVPTEPITRLPLLPAQEVDLLQGWSHTTGMALPEGCVHHWFEVQAAVLPEKTAVFYADQHLTYAQLNERANQLAHYLIEKGAKPDTIVGLHVSPSLEMMVALLGILKAGGAYLPLDPSYPANRLQYMVDDARPPIIVTTTELSLKLDMAVTQVVHITGGEQFIQYSRQNPQTGVAGEHLAYIIYTSGSTGKPKGVQIEHGAMANFVQAAAISYPITREDCVLQFATIAFDTAVEEIYPCLTQGGTLALRTETMITTMSTFVNLCAAWGITVLDLPTAFWHHLTASLASEGLHLPPAVRLVIIGGEKANEPALRQWQQCVGPDVRLLNTYGPTEGTVVTTMYEAQIASADTVSKGVLIGRPLPNYTVHVLDTMRQPVPIGVSGELWIGGSGLARGYLNQPELTQEKFIPNPFGSGRLYRTGDLVSYLPDGALEFLGRTDDQVKIRGFRIELGEIEAALLTHTAVREAIVIAREDQPGERRLVAYVILHDTTTPPTQTMLRDFVAETLPAYMVPAAFVYMDEFPKTPNRKIDRKALPMPDLNRDDLGRQYVAPRTQVEEIVAQVMAESLNLEKVGIWDNFFELGGHSLLVTRLLFRITELFHVELQLRSFFENPTVAGTAELMLADNNDRLRIERTAQLLIKLSRLSDEDVAAMLKSRGNV